MFNGKMEKKKKSKCIRNIYFDTNRPTIDPKSSITSSFIIREPDVLPCPETHVGIVESSSEDPSPSKNVSSECPATCEP